DPRPEPRTRAPGGDGREGRRDDGRDGPARRGPRRSPEGEDPRAAQETEVRVARDRFLGRPRAHPGLPRPTGGAVRVLRVVAGPRRHEPPDFGGAGIAGAI